MLFNSLDFFLFFFIVYLLYLIIPFRSQNLLLLGASYFFYGCWDVRFLFLITFSTAVDFFCSNMMLYKSLGRKNLIKTNVYVFGATLLFLGLLNGQEIAWKNLGKPAFGYGISSMIGFFAITMLSDIFAKKLSDEVRKQMFVTLSIMTNLGILCFFKYFNFFVENAVQVLSSLGVSVAHLSNLKIILPVGISFYTFKTISYSIDVYRGKLHPADRLFDFALYIAYFPQLVAGPIDRATNLLPKIQTKRSIQIKDLTRGFVLMSYGLFKKVVIADGLAASVSSIYNTQGTVSICDILAATLLFTIQIYCDFSGYTDIARGLSKCFGIDIMRNFNSPYFSDTPSEFWKRWHISLSSWLRDYLYIPLGGNRSGPKRTYLNLMVTMALGGLWHGAGWNYILWGIYHGILLCVYRMSNFTDAVYKSFKDSTLVKVLTTLLFFVITCYGWLLFRAESLHQIISFSKVLISGYGHYDLSLKIPTFATLCGLPFFLMFEIRQFVQEKATLQFNMPVVVKGAVYGMMLMIFFGSLSNDPVQFIYIQF